MDYTTYDKEVLSRRWLRYIRELSRGLKINWFSSSEIEVIFEIGTIMVPANMIIWSSRGKHVLDKHLETITSGISAIRILKIYQRWAETARYDKAKALSHDPKINTVFR